MLARWHASPSTGSKLRDADLVAERLATWGVETIVLPFVGCGKELCAYDGSAKLIVADTDPAMRAYWRCANEGGLERAAVKARAAWDSALTLELDDRGDFVQRAWKRLCAVERVAIDRGLHAAWALATMAGARNGGRRRNKKGEYNWPYAPKSNGVRDPEWLTRRIPSAEKLRAADAWARDRIVAVLDDFEEAFRLAAIEPAPKRAAYLVDPPYGHEKEALYDGTWTNEKRDRLVALVAGAASRGARLIVWCGVEDIDVFRVVPLDWRFRPAKTHMKSGGERKGGAVEENRSAGGGWMGISV